MDDEKIDGGLSALTDVLCKLFPNFECHPLSREADEIERAGKAMREAAIAIERMAAYLAYDASCPCCLREDVCEEGCSFEEDAPQDFERMQMARAALGHNVQGQGDGQA